MDANERELDRDGLLALVRELRAEIAAARAESAALRARIVELERSGPTSRPGESYSVDAEERRRRDADAAKSGREKKHGASGDRQQSKRRGRVPADEKIDNADRREIILPEGRAVDECVFVREWPAWRIIDGRAALFTYDIFRRPDEPTPRIPGVPSRSEFGVEIHATVAYLTYIVGLSLEKVCRLVKYFWNLDLSKSQADSLLNQLSREWSDEFEALCQLLAVSAVVGADETGWSLNSVWALLSEKSRVFVFGCRKDAATLESLLPKALFQGVLVSDDAAVYQGFTTAQKCWAHLLRKAIRLKLLRPDEALYNTFLDGLLDVYRSGCSIAKDKRLSDAERREKVDELSGRVCELCGERVADEAKPEDEVERDFYNLAHELVRLVGDDELFTFVLNPAVPGTNNERERSLRVAAIDRKTRRASKTFNGARRRTIINSVLESLRLYLPAFTLEQVVAEAASWLHAGLGRFRRLAQASGLAPPETTILGRLVPNPA